MDGGMETMNTQESILKTIEDKREQYIHAALDIWDYAEPIFEEYNFLIKFFLFSNKSFSFSFSLLIEFVSVKFFVFGFLFQQFYLFSLTALFRICLTSWFTSPIP